jgi:hypothetical protein
VFVFLTNSTAVFQNARTVPSEVHKTWAQYLSWQREDVAWNGNWNAHPEGYVDEPSMSLTRTDSELVLWVKHGAIDGTYAARDACKTLPLLNYVLVEGSVHFGGNSADVTLFDFVGGHRVEFGKLKLRRDGVLLEVEKIGGRDWIPTAERLARVPDSEPNPNHAFCEQERVALFESPRRSGALSNGAERRGQTPGKRSAPRAL